MRDGFDENGRFAPGNRLGSPVGNAYKKQVLDALKQRWTPDKIVALLDDIDATATSTRSPKAKLALAELILGYVLGKPKQSLEVGTGDNTQLLAALLADRTPLLPPRQGIIEDDSLLIEAHNDTLDDD